MLLMAKIKCKFFKIGAYFSIIMLIMTFVAIISHLIFNSINAFFSPEIKIDLSNNYQISQSDNNHQILVNELNNMIKKQFKNHDVDIANLVNLDPKIKLFPNEQRFYLAGKIVYQYLIDPDIIADSETKDILAFLKKNELIRLKFNLNVFFNKDSREVELAGIAGGIIGSIYTIMICIIISLPIGVLAGIYIEEFVKNSICRRIIDININNLAAIPSIVYGLLGLNILIFYCGMPRSSPLVGGITLSFITIPAIIITTRQSLKAIPETIRESLCGLGVSKVQALIDHIIPLALPGIISGSMIGFARAIGETAPLILIGMVAFIKDVPMSITDPSTTMPVLIYTWFNSPETIFSYKTSAAILTLLVIIFSLNYIAIIIKRKFEREW